MGTETETANERDTPHQAIGGSRSTMGPHSGRTTPEERCGVEVAEKSEGLRNRHAFPGKHEKLTGGPSLIGGEDERNALEYSHNHSTFRILVSLYATP
mmetsp:Transcript_30345/g.59641  ORF Transcript_30345/g.59641 Transcript_30345/m.59641 type:complete len:98 (+) Transcript_30345:498-791(+)